MATRDGTSRGHARSGRRAVPPVVAGLVGVGAILAGQATAAPLSCSVREVENVGSSRGLAATVALSASGDGAVAWSPSAQAIGGPRIRRLEGAVPVGPRAALHTGRVRGLQAVTTGAGEVQLVFQQLGAVPQSVAAATFDGRRLSAPTPLSRRHSSRPDVSVGPDGTARVAWIEPEVFIGYKVVTATRAPGGEWSAPAEVAVVPPPATIDNVQVLAGRRGRATIAWRSGVTGVGALTLGPSGVALGPPIAIQSGSALVLRLALGGSPAGPQLAWIEEPGVRVATLSTVRLSPDGEPGPVSRLSSAPAYPRDLWITSGSGRFGLLAWTERSEGTLRARVARRDTRDGTLSPWIAPVAASESGVGLAVAPGGRAAVVWRALTDGRRVTRIASGSLTRARPTDHGTIARPRLGPGAPSVAVSRTGRVAIASVDAVPRTFRHALRLASCERGA